MPFAAKIYRILISYPSDVGKVRDAAIHTINEWNYTQSGEHGVFLEPVTWETHVPPELGVSAQEIINREIVDSSDLLVGIFWTRFGSPTESFGSGTEEEINLFLESKKQVMLYFSDEKINPSKIDNEQFERVKKFRKDNSQRGLYKTFKNIQDFKSKFKDHLTQKMRQIIKSRPAPDSNGLVDAKLMWNSNVADEFLLNERELTIVFKDGYTFFTSKGTLLKKRFKKTGFFTRILLVHPDYEHIGGVADMDPQKAGNPQRQRQDCVSGIKTMQTIRSELLAETRLDIAKRVPFIGYRNVPTWNGMLGVSRSVVSLYPTHAHRGDLVTLEICKDIASDGRSFWFNRYLNDIDELIRSLKSRREQWDLWSYEIEAK